MTRGQPRGRGGNANGSRGNGFRGGRGSRGGRGRGRGRGGGNALVVQDYSMAEFTYDDLISDETLGFNPSPAFQIPVLPTPNPYPTRPTPQSGASTPSRGAHRGGSFAGRGNRGRGGTHTPASYPDSGRDSPSFGGGRGGRGRGGGLGLGTFNARGRGRGGTASPRGAFIGSGPGRSPNPLLVPVKFVPAQGPGLGTVGGDDEHGLEKAGAEAPAPPSTSAFVHQQQQHADSQLADQVGRIDLEQPVHDLSVPETAFEPEPETTATMALDELEDAPRAGPDETSRHPGLGAQRHAAPAVQTEQLQQPASTELVDDSPSAAIEDEPPLFEISVTRSEVVLDSRIAPPPALDAHRDDFFATGRDSEEDEDSDDEQIVYPVRAVAQADPVYSARPAQTQVRALSPSSADFTTLPREAARPPPAAKRASHPALPKQPAPKSKKALKRESHAARKAGRAHARSGNGHLGGGRTLADSDEDGSEDVEVANDVAAGAALFAQMQGGTAGIDDMLDVDDDNEEEEDDGPSGAHIDGQPRLDDSDVDWGSASPPPIGLGARSRGRAKKQFMRQQRADQRQAEKMERLIANGGTREEVEIMLAIEASLRDAEEDVDMGEQKVSKRRAQERQRLANDYLANLDLDAEGDDSMAILAAFANGAVGELGGVHERGDDLDRRAEEDEDNSDEWGTSDESDSEGDDSDSDDEDTADAADRKLAREEENDSEDVTSSVELEMEYSLGDADGRVEHSMSLASSDSDSDDSSLSSSTDSDVELHAFEAALLAGGKVKLSSMGQAGGGGRRAERDRKKERRRERKGKMRAAESSSDDDSEDAEMFGGNNTWADEDEEYIARLQNVVRANADLLETAKGGKDARRSNRRERNKLFKAISNGDFDDIDLYEDMDDLDDDMVAEMLAAEEDRAMGYGGPKKQRKKEKNYGGAFSASLAEQWELDRKSKAQKKAERAATRAAAREAETRDSFYGGGRKAGKKARATRDAASQSNDAATVNRQIVQFIKYDIGEMSMALPPMSKKSRIAVHMLAETYGLKSRSMGKGNARFPVLERTTRTTLKVNERKIVAIIGTADGEDELGSNYGARPRGGKMSGLWKALEGASGKRSGGGGGGRGGGSGIGRNNEGAVVGQGADKLGTENIGFALLKKMGWSEGGQIGLSGGLHEPVAARVKTNRQGLGSGFSVSMREAYGMARAPSRDE